MKQLITIGNINRVFKNKGYTFNDKINIVGIRRNTIRTWKFNDYISIIFENKIKIFKATTDPCSFWLRNPTKMGEMIILKPGQYKSWEMNKYNWTINDRITQTQPIDVWINNEDNDLIIGSGIFKLDIHCTNPYTDDIKDFSLGSQVFQKKEDFYELVDTIKKYQESNIVTYTLIEESDLYDILEEE